MPHKAPVRNKGTTRWGLQQSCMGRTHPIYSKVKLRGQLTQQVKQVKLDWGNFPREVKQEELIRDELTLRYILWVELPRAAIVIVMSI